MVSAGDILRRNHGGHVELKPRQGVKTIFSKISKYYSPSCQQWRN